MTNPAIADHIHRHRGSHLEAIRELVRQPSVSLENAGMRESAQLVASHLEDVGAVDVRVLDVGDTYPGVFGHIDDGAPVTLLVYGHYDVRPVGTEPWSRDPFSGEIGAAGDFPEVVFGRGAVASKGPLQTFLCALDSIRKVDGRLPVNIYFLIEGAEILGSLNYLKLLEASGLDRTRVSAVYGPAISQGLDGSVGVRLGYKGLLYFELVCSGERWGRGPQGEAVASSANVVVDNPAWRLIGALSALADADGRPRSEDLQSVFAARRPVAPWEQVELERIQALAAERGANAVVPGLSSDHPLLNFRLDRGPEAVMEEYLYGPSLSVSGLRSGYTGPGSKSFLLPAEAIATLDIRVISERSAEDIVGMVRAQLDVNGFRDIGIDVMGAYDWYQASPDDAMPSAVLATLRKRDYATDVWPMVSYGGPWAHVPKMLGVSGVMGGAPGFGANSATSDEYFVVEGAGSIEGLEEAEAFYVDLLFSYRDAATR